MLEKRKIVAVVKKSSAEDAANSYLFFWADKNIAERFEELLRLKRNYWSWKLGKYPDHIEKRVSKRSLYAGE